MAELWALLPADGAAAVMAAVNALASVTSADDVRTVDQRRADGLVDLGVAALHDPRLPRAQGQRPSVQITVALSTLLGIDEQPADLDGHGPIPAGLARRIAADPTGTWRRLLTDPASGRLLDCGRTTYRPPTDIADFVMARDRACTFPGCGRPAQRCDLDHRVPYDDGGRTAADNLHVLCRRHHRAKHIAGWFAHRAQIDDGRTAWTSPTSHEYVSTADPLPRHDDLQRPGPAAVLIGPPTPSPTGAVVTGRRIRQGGVVNEANFADYQFRIYARGMFEQQYPTVTTDLANLEAKAAEVLPEAALGYITAAAGSGATTAANRAAFDRWHIVPRMLNGTTRRDYGCTVLGTEMLAPVLLAPVGVQTLAHRDGELATARAAAAVGLTYVHSTQASYSFEQVAEANGDGSRWYQLYWPNDRDLCVSFLQRAAAVGYSTLVVTLDTVVLAWRPHDLDRGYLPFLANQGVANYLSDPVFRAGLAAAPEDDPAGAALRFVQLFPNPGLAWSDLPFLRQHWDGPILLKGIQSVADARRAVEHGVDGIVVSNHGGRQVDGAIASLDALVPIAEAVGDDLTVLFDSGVRTGSDLVKALALGAEAVLLGRPVLCGLALDGQAGVEHVLRSILAEFDLTCVLSGHHSHRDLCRESVVRADSRA